MYINYIIKLRYYIRKEKVENRRKMVYNVYIIARLTGTVLYTGKVGLR